MSDRTHQYADQEAEDEDGADPQMIAARIGVGVGKAAVYYPFRSKEEVALNVVRPYTQDVERILRSAETLPDMPRRRAVAMSGLIQMIVRHRRLASIFLRDPAIEQLMLGEPDRKAVADRFRELLERPERTTADRVAVSVFLSGICSAAADPDLTDVGDDELRDALLDLSSRILTPSDECWGGEGGTLPP